jgi:signal transduction histidine kinase
MTLRLVGLMSFVLLLSLAAFAFMTNHYQDQVMQELEETVSTVGRAALNSFVHRVGGPDHPDGKVWIRHFDAASTPAAVGNAEMDLGADCLQPDEDCETATFERRILVVGSFEDMVRVQGPEDGEPPHPQVVKRVETTPGRYVVREELGTTESTSGSEGGFEWSYSVHVDGVRAEEDPDRGLVLKIPTNRAAGDDVRLVELSEPTAPVAVSQDIVLPIDTAEYSSLFSRFERSSLALFLGVFALGTVLSAGLASRFTRPIRRLDRGIRRISEGDLDAEVEVRGQGEIARLGRAFNEMTRELRAGRERARELTRREKLSALGRLAAGVAHDVRNPLHSIGLTLQHLRETGRPETEDRRNEFDRSVGLIRNEISRLDELVANFLRFARNDRRELQPVDLAALLHETARLVRKEAEWREIRLEVEIEGEIPPIEADAESVRSSILNLVLNSFEAMPDGGRVTLAARVADGEIRVVVSDDGQGMPEEDRERVFEFAYTTRDGGHGLGLAMVHQCVVEDHGGRVHLDSRPGQGTRVTLAFPQEAPAS